MREKIEYKCGCVENAYNGFGWFVCSLHEQFIKDDQPDFCEGVKEE